MSTLGMVGEPATQQDTYLCFICTVGWLGFFIRLAYEGILRELRKQSEGKGKDGGK